MSPLPNLSRRTAMATLGGGVAALAARGAAPAAAQGATPVADAAGEPLPPDIAAIIGKPAYGLARWGIHVADRTTGEVVYDLRGDERFLAASTTKLFPGAAALAAYGPGHRFETPIYRTGAVDADGTVAGNLVLVASGDPTLGGRTTAAGGIAFTPVDHIYANVFPELATLTPENPLAGVDELASQVAAAGIRRVDDVVIDARLFPAMAKDDYVLSPIWINDNLIDISIRPGDDGAAAAVEQRPQSAAYRVQADVRTVSPSETLRLNVASPSPGVIAVEGQIPANVPHAVQTFQVADPPAFARTVLIEALARAGVAVAAEATGANPDAKLPAPGEYAAAARVALFTSPPFAENIKLIFKVSMNQHADLLIFLLALKHGETGFDAGLAQIRPFLSGLGLDPDLVSLADGRGNEYTDLFSPRTVSRLLQAMATRPDFANYFDALPILGVDGSEVATVGPTSPVRGRAFAKSGTTVAGDPMNERALVMVRALAGYLTARSGRELIFTTYVSDVPMADVNDVFAIIEDQGAIAEIVFERY